jgi:hypothetical protein
VLVCACSITASLAHLPRNSVPDIYGAFYVIIHFVLVALKDYFSLNPKAVKPYTSETFLRGESEDSTTTIKQTDDNLTSPESPS